MRNKKVILSSILSLVLCLSLIAGGTFALFTSESKTNIAVTSGTVKVVATIDEDTVVAYSPTSINMDGSVADDTNAAEGNTFKNGGSFAYVPATETDPATFTLTNITPGDKVDFNIDVENQSNVTIQYRVVISDVEGGSLNGLVMKLNDNDYAGTTIYSDWAYIGAQDTINSIPVSIELPANAGNEHQNKTTKLSVTVEAVQGNTNTATSTSVSVNSSTELNTAFETSDSVTVVGGTVTDDNLTVPEGKELIIKDVSLDTSDNYGIGVSVGKNASLILNGGTYKAFGYSQVIDAQAEGSEVTVNGGSYDGNYLLFVNNDAKATINDCTFATPELPATVIATQDSDGSPSIRINGGTFYSEAICNNIIDIAITGGTFYIDAISDYPSVVTSENIIITGGAFTVDPTAYLADGFTATQNADNMWIVSAN